MAAPFHLTLGFFANRSPDSHTVRFSDSLRGNLALGLDFPVALAIAAGRHLFLRNVSLFSLKIHIPSVSQRATPLEGVIVDEKRDYTRAEIFAQARKDQGFLASLDAVAIWALAADVNTGLLKGEDVVSFQRGTLLERLERRRKDRQQVLPLYRGGPISVAGHSWAVKTFFDVEVYRWDHRSD